jgi:hypothetical protein
MCQEHLQKVSPIPLNAGEKKFVDDLGNPITQHTPPGLRI